MIYIIAVLLIVVAIALTIINRRKKIEEKVIEDPLQSNPYLAKFKPANQNNRVKDILYNSIVKKVYADAEKVGVTHVLNKNGRLIFGITNRDNKEQVKEAERAGFLQVKFFNVFPENGETIKYLYLIGKIYLLRIVTEKELVVPEDEIDNVKNFLTLTDAEERSRLDFISQAGKSNTQEI